MPNNELNPTRLHCLDGDDDDVGYWSRGHHSEEAMRLAVASAYPPDERHPNAADPAQCAYFMGWWRRVPRGDGGQFHRAVAGSRGAFQVTALLVPGCDI